ncbi:MAG: glucose-6-phosphate isomerase [Cellvibrionaceae bacterium]|jgi:glucose-6-phosphate isomerase
MNSSLTTQHQRLKSKKLVELFNEQSDRDQLFSIEAGGLYFDYSKNHIDENVVQTLCQFAQDQGMKEAVDALLNGESINNTEGRAAHHSALREPLNNSSISGEIQAVLKEIGDFVEVLHDQNWMGFSGQPIKDVVNIGIGGSDLGPRMVTQALSAFHRKMPKVHFVANIDGADLEDTLIALKPETTMFIVASKSFTTLETLNNALSARQWITSAGCKEVQLKQHFVAISSNVAAASAFGIAKENIFPMWDWVGGRYSLWSAIGLPIAIAIGMDNFRDLLAGAHAMDKHFRDAPLAENMPVIAALINHWYSHYWGASSQAILPYAQRLSRLPAYLQQLDMESLGKRVHKDGTDVDQPTGLVIWGAEGTNGQHSFHQLLHQGTQLIPVDFIAVKASMSQHQDQHQYLLACCLSQSQALLQGKTREQAGLELRAQDLPEEQVQLLIPHKVIPGNKPSNTILLDSLNPKSLGALIAFYEHRVFATSVLLDINAFDQWGVELGKQLGTPLYQALTGGESDSAWDNSTRSLIKRLKK